MAKFDNITEVVDWLVSEDNDGAQEAAELIRDLVQLHIDTMNEVEGYDEYDDTLGLALPGILDLVGSGEDVSVTD